jgi:hypothetical protein
MNTYRVVLAATSKTTLSVDVEGDFVQVSTDGRLVFRRRSTSSSSLAEHASPVEVAVFDKNVWQYYTVVQPATPQDSV